MTTMQRLLALAAALLALAGCAQAGRGDAPGAFSIGIIGDAPYLDIERERVAAVIAEMSREPLAFVAHVGDIKAGGTTCGDDVFEDRRRLFAESAHPFVLIPGDNEWTDCHRGGHDPIERLNALRRLFWSTPQTLGRTTMAVERQRGYPENSRWVRGGVVFVTLNVPGSNNNLGGRAVGDHEYRTRNVANLSWIAQAFQIARRDKLAGVMLMMQANPYFELAPGSRDRNGYDDLVARLEEEVKVFGKPVVLVHGDTHTFRVDQPLYDTRTQKKLSNFTRIETFGSPFVHWVRITVDASKPEVFSAVARY